MFIHMIFYLNSNKMLKALGVFIYGSLFFPKTYKKTAIAFNFQPSWKVTKRIVGRFSKTLWICMLDLWLSTKKKQFEKSFLQKHCPILSFNKNFYYLSCCPTGSIILINQFEQSLFGRSFFGCSGFGRINIQPIYHVYAIYKHLLRLEVDIHLVL